MRHAFLPSAMARWVLPVPGGPNRTRSSWPAMKSRVVICRAVVDGEADRGPVVAAELLVGGESGGLEQA